MSVTPLELTTPSGRPARVALVHDWFAAYYGSERVVEQILHLFPEADLFTLSALRTQDELHERELVRVTNMSPSVVKTTVKHLEQRGLLDIRDGRVSILTDEIPAVRRTLRRVFSQR